MHLNSWLNTVNMKVPQKPTVPHSEFFQKKPRPSDTEGLSQTCMLPTQPETLCCVSSRVCVCMCVMKEYLLPLLYNKRKKLDFVIAWFPRIQQCNVKIMRSNCFRCFCDKLGIVAKHCSQQAPGGLILDISCKLHISYQANSLCNAVNAPYAQSEGGWSVSHLCKHDFQCHNSYSSGLEWVESSLCYLLNCSPKCDIYHHVLILMLFQVFWNHSFVKETQNCWKYCLLC